jgi:riboflavin kinase/FMN adenylyltransferase
MEVCHWPVGEPPARCDSVTTFGVFDGVHLGHQKILGRVVDAARQREARAAVITFDRHPHRVIEAPPQPFITSLEHRLRLFDELGLNLAVVVRFTPQVARMPAEEFARQVFHGLLQTRLLIVGPDARFGSGGEGDVQLLQRMGPELGLKCRVVERVVVEGDVVSSTAIRHAVRRAQLERAAALLGRPFSLYGIVVHGAGRGRELGFPTVNLDVHNELLPAFGVYATRARFDGRWWDSVTSLGRQPTFHPGARGPVVVEAYVMDMERERDLYGQHVEVQFVRRLRSQERFETAEALVEQMERDVEEARAALRAAERAP